MGVRNRAIAGCVLVAFGCGGESIRHRGNGGTGAADGSGGTGAGTAAAAGSGGTGAATAAGTGGVAAAGGGQSGAPGAAACGNTSLGNLDCGTCSNDCVFYCSYGHCELSVAEGQDNTSCVALDATNVYWATADLTAHVGSIWRAERGGGPHRLVTADLAPLWTCKMVVDANNLYVASQFDWQVVQVPLGGGPTLTLSRNDYRPDAVAVHGPNVYFAESSGAIRRVPVGGGEITTLADEGGELEGFAIDDTYAYWSTRDGMPISGRILRVPLAGGSVEKLLDKVSTGTGLAVDDENVYWIDYEGSHVLARPKHAGAVSTLASDLALPRVLVRGGSSLFVGALGGVFEVPTSGRAALPFVSGPTIEDIAVDDASVVYSTGITIFDVRRK